MIAMTARMIGLLMLTAVIATAAGTVPVGPADRQAEDAAAAAKRAKDTTEKQRANRPAEHDRRALPGYQDDLERAQRREEKAARKAKDADREAGQAARKAESADRARKLEQRREDRDERRQREIDDRSRHP